MIFKTKSITSFTACFNLSCAMLLYRDEKSKVEAEETLSVLFSKLTTVITA